MRNNDESLPNLVWDLTLAVRALRKEVRRGRRGVEQEPAAAFRREHKGYNEGYLAGHADGELCGAKEDADVISRVESDRRIESEFERGKYIGYKQGYEAGVRDGKWSGRGEFQIGDGSPMYGPVTSTNNTGAENDG